MYTASSHPLARAAWRARRLVLLGAGPLALAACHHGGGEERTVTVRVQNNLVPAVALRISLLPSTGAVRTIGVVGPARTEELRVPLGTDADPHRLLAEAGSAPATTSRQFTLATASRVEWNVGANILNEIRR